MYRNLGASRVGTSLGYTLAFGDLYQWGRATNGHEKRNSPLTSIQATSYWPNEGNNWDGFFIINSEYWLTLIINSLWSTEINNSCLSGFRLSTPPEREEEMDIWEDKDQEAAFYSILKLTMTGERW